VSSVLVCFLFFSCVCLFVVLLLAGFFLLVVCLLYIFALQQTLRFLKIPTNSQKADFVA